MGDNILHELASAIWYTARDNIHQYSCNNPFIMVINIVTSLEFFWNFWKFKMFWNFFENLEILKSYEIFESFKILRIFFEILNLNFVFV